MNRVLINVSTHRFQRSVRLLDGDVASPKGDGTSKSMVSRKFIALSNVHNPNAIDHQARRRSHFPVEGCAME